MKKIIAAALAGALCVVSLCACGSKATNSDYEYVKANKKMVIGITEYEPMNYYGTDGELTGFDTEFAQAVCKELGIEAEFQIIDWDTKETELKSKNIDCIWNGLTVTEERKENMDFTKAYLSNKQCVITTKANAKFASEQNFESVIISAESGSAGETAIKSNESLAKAKYVPANSQQDALIGLLAGNYDAIVVDYTLGSASVGKGNYVDMTIIDSIVLEDELYAVGFRLGSDLTDKVNEIIDKFVSDGTLKALAEKYNVVELYNQAIAK